MARVGQICCAVVLMITTACGADVDPTPGRDAGAADTGYDQYVPPNIDSGTSPPGHGQSKNCAPAYCFVLNGELHCLPKLCVEPNLDPPSPK